MARFYNETFHCQLNSLIGYFQKQQCLVQGKKESVHLLSSLSRKVSARFVKYMGRVILYREEHQAACKLSAMWVFIRRFEPTYKEYRQHIRVSATYGHRGRAARIPTRPAVHQA
jgi:hypothetical protein